MKRIQQGLVLSRRTKIFACTLGLALSGVNGTSRAQPLDTSAHCETQHTDKNRIQWWTAAPGAYETCLWNQTFKEYLNAPLWEPRDNYDAGHQLYVPILSAHYFDIQEWGDQIHHHYAKYAAIGDPPIELGALSRLQYEFTLSEWLASAAEFNKPQWDVDGMADRLIQTTIALWLEVPAWQWMREPFAGMKSRVEWKLSQGPTDPSYLRASIDAEWFLFGTAANLVRYLRAKRRPVSSTLLEILEVAEQVFDKGVQTDEINPWRFEVGRWSDSPSHAYAGHHDVFPGMEKKSRPKVVTDSSHAMRLGPLFRSCYLATKGTPSHQFWKKQIGLLSEQLNEQVFVTPNQSFTSWRTTNYLDGYNGLYRWNYSKKMRDKGYRPYQLSGSLLLGWWSALGPSTAHVFVGIAHSFPLDQMVQDTYEGPKTWRERHPMVAIPQEYSNGAAELKARLASRIAFRALQSPFPARCEQHYPFSISFLTKHRGLDEACAMHKPGIVANIRAWIAAWIQSEIQRRTKFAAEDRVD